MSKTHAFELSKLDIVKYSKLNEKSLKISNNNAFIYKFIDPVYCKLIDVYLLSIRPISIRENMHNVTKSRSTQSTYNQFVINYNLSFVIRNEDTDLLLKQFNQFQYNIVTNLTQLKSCKGLIQNQNQNNLMKDMYSPLYQYNKNVCILNVNVIGNETVLFNVNMYDINAKKIRTEISTLQKFQNVYFKFPLKIGLFPESVSYNGMKTSINWKLVQIMISQIIKPDKRELLCSLNLYISHSNNIDKMYAKYNAIQLNIQTRQQYNQQQIDCSSFQQPDMIDNVLATIKMENLESMKKIDDIMFEDTMGNEV